MNRINQNIEAATKAIRLLLENQQCSDLPGRVGENGVKTRVANRDFLNDGETLNAIDIKTNIAGDHWELDSRMEQLDEKCLRLAMMFNCQCSFEDFGNGWNNRLEVRVSHA